MESDLLRRYNIESIPLSFQVSADGSNWYGPNKQGPYYYVYNFNYGDDTAVATLAQENVVAGIISFEKVFSSIHSWSSHFCISVSSFLIGV